MPLQLSKSRATLSPKLLESFQNNFKRDHCVSLPALFESELLSLVQKYIDASSFYHREHPGIGVEDCMEENVLDTALHFILNDPVVLSTVESITGVSGIGMFAGRLYRLAPTLGHLDSWHSDVVADRVIGLSINVGREAFSGGMLQLRFAESKQLIGDFSVQTPGNALLFRISSELEHRVAAVTGSVPRTVFAGWFKSKPSFQEFLADRLSSIPERKSDTDQRQKSIQGQLANDIRLAPSPEIIMRRFRELGVLIDMAQGVWYRLDDFGYSLCERLANRQSLNTICEEVYNQYDAPRDVIEQDLRVFAARLVDCGILSSSHI